MSFSSAPTQAFRPPDQPRWGGTTMAAPVARLGATDGRRSAPNQTGSPCGGLRSGRDSLASPQTWRSEAQPL